MDTELDMSTLIKNPLYSPAQPSRGNNGLAYIGTACSTALTFSNWTWDAPQMYMLEKSVEQNVNPIVEYGLAVQRVGLDSLHHSDISTHFHENDLTFKSINTQIPPNSLDFNLPGQSGYQAKPLPNPQQLQLKRAELRPLLRAIKPKVNSSPQNPGQRPSRKPGARSKSLKIGYANRKVRDFRWCWNCHKKDSVSSYEVDYIETRLMRISGFVVLFAINVGTSRRLRPKL